MKKYYIFFAIVSIIANLYSQNTVGIISNSAEAYNGYTLFTSHKSTYLINNCGEIINKWTSNYIDGKSVYLLEDGSILRTGVIENTDISIPGIGGIIEKIDWDDNVIWSYTYSSSSLTQHHDIYPMSNGNILILALTKKTAAEAIQAGRDPALLDDADLYNEQVIEIAPDLINGGASIVWEWNIWDHLIQDFDNTKDNFGVVSNSPQLLDINYLGTSDKKANWLHCNSIQYNEDLDEIIISARQMNEIYIIDHSTTTLEASLHSGGNRNKGGDILYRWGNPFAYGKGLESDQKLFGQHTPHWIPSTYNDGGKILLFNNGFGRSTEYSTVEIISPEKDMSGNYTYTGAPYGPTNLDWSYQDPTTLTDFFSRIMSSAQRLPNGNTLICDSDSGYLFEIDNLKNKVWEYINPQRNNGDIIAQGDTPLGNLTFRAFKYELSYPAFTGRDLTPQGTIETGASLQSCSILSTKDAEFADLKIFPNPVKNILNIKSKHNIDRIEVYNVIGKKIQSNYSSNKIDISYLSKGIYFVKINFKDKSISKKIVKQ